MVLFFKIKIFSPAIRNGVSYIGKELENYVTGGKKSRLIGTRT